MHEHATCCDVDRAPNQKPALPGRPHHTELCVHQSAAAAKHSQACLAVHPRLLAASALAATRHPVCTLAESVCGAAMAAQCAALPAAAAAAAPCRQPARGRRSVAGAVPGAARLPSRPANPLRRSSSARRQLPGGRSSGGLADCTHAPPALPLRLSCGFQLRHHSFTKRAWLLLCPLQAGPVRWRWMPPSLLTGRPSCGRSTASRCGAPPRCCGGRCLRPASRDLYCCRRCRCFSSLLPLPQCAWDQAGSSGPPACRLRPRCACCADAAEDRHRWVWHLWTVPGQAHGAGGARGGWWRCTLLKLLIEVLPPV